MSSASALQGAPIIPTSHLREYLFFRVVPTWRLAFCFIRGLLVVRSLPVYNLYCFFSRCSTLYKRPVKATDEGISSPCLPLDATDRSQNVWQWILESERQGKHRPHRLASTVAPTASSGLNSNTPLYPGRGFPLISCVLDSTQGLRKSSPLDSKTLPNRNHSWGGGGIGSGVHPRGHHPGHPFIQDPAMPPLPPPNTLAQLEEACRRLEEVSKPPKQR